MENTMKLKQFEKEISKIQNFLWLDDWDSYYEMKDSPWFMWEVSYIDYKRFQVRFTFDKAILREPDKEIKSILIHEYCHLFTIANLRQFSTDEYLKNQLWWNNHAEIVTRMDILNEQMTVRLERILTKYYLWN